MRAGARGQYPLVPLAEAGAAKMPSLPTGKGSSEVDPKKQSELRRSLRSPEKSRADTGNGNCAPNTHIKTWHK